MPHSGRLKSFLYNQGKDKDAYSYHFDSTIILDILARIIRQGKKNKRRLNQKGRSKMSSGNKFNQGGERPLF